MAIQDSHPLFIQAVQSPAVGTYGMGFLDNVWNQIKTTASAELNKAKTQLSTQFEQEKQKAIQSGLTQLQAGATKLIQDQAAKLLNDPAKIQQVKDAAVPKISQQVASAVEPAVKYVMDNPKKTALYVGLGVLGVVALFVLAGRGAAVSVVRAKNPSRRRR